MIETLSSYHSHKFGGCLWDFSYNPESKIGLFLLDLPFTKVDSRHSRRMWSHSSSYNCFEQDLSCHVNRLSMMHFKYNLCMKVEMLTLKMCEKPWSMQNLPHFLIYHVLKSPSSICYWTRESAVYSSVMCAVHCTPYYFPCFITVLLLRQNSRVCALCLACFVGPGWGQGSRQLLKNILMGLLYNYLMINK